MPGNPTQQATFAAAGRRALVFKPARVAAAQIRRGASVALRITYTPKAGRSVVRRATIAVR